MVVLPARFLSLSL